MKIDFKKIIQLVFTYVPIFLAIYFFRHYDYSVLLGRILPCILFILSAAPIFLSQSKES